MTFCTPIKTNKQFNLIMKAFWIIMKTFCVESAAMFCVDFFFQFERKRIAIRLEWLNSQKSKTNTKQTEFFDEH